MAAPQPPVAIRITRPYESEDEFLAHELDTISRTGVTLVGAQQRPEGVVLRFELTLASGLPILRGEGRVIGFKAAAHGSEAGLSLRFTRLDSKSKALVDKVGAMREARGRSKPPPLPTRRSVVPPPLPPPPPIPQPPPIPSSAVLVVDSAPELSPTSSARSPTSSPTQKTAALERLRGRKVSADEIAKILADGATKRGQIR